MIINNELANVIQLISLFKQNPYQVPNTCHLVKEQFVFFVYGQIWFPRDLMLWGWNSICMWLGMILGSRHTARAYLFKQVGEWGRVEKPNQKKNTHHIVPQVLKYVCTLTVVESRLVLKEEMQRASKGNRYVHYLRCGDGFTGVYTSKLIIQTVQLKNLPFIAHHLCLNKAT